MATTGKPAVSDSAMPTSDRVAPATGTAAPPNALADLRDRVLRWIPLVAVAAGVLIVFLGQLVEDLDDSGPVQMLSPSDAVRRWTIVLAVLYMVLIGRWVDRLVDRSLASLQRTLHFDPEKFRSFTEPMRRLSITVEVSLLALSAAIVTLLFVGLGTSLPIDDPVTNAPTFLPASGLNALVVVLAYEVLGWALMSVVVVTIRRGRALARLSKEPLAVDVYDTTDLLPLGNIALATSLAPAGIIVILLIGFGRPSGALLSWSILLLATSASLVALIGPLLGIHSQMLKTKRLVLRQVNGRIREIHEQVTGGQQLDGPDTNRLNGELALLATLRKTVMEMTSWPFRDSLTFGRAVLIAGAPLIYAVMTELIKVIFIDPLHGR
jgi:hypothetical protein